MQYKVQNLNWSNTFTISCRISQPLFFFYFNVAFHKREILIFARKVCLIYLCHLKSSQNRAVTKISVFEFHVDSFPYLVTNIQ